eukprot:gene38800-47188_t
MAEFAMDIEENGEVATGKIAPSHLPWVEKYRPSSLDDLIAHEDIIKILNQLIDNNKLPHLLFYGPPGTGKTSTIIACAKKMYGEHYGSMTLELNASDDRGIDVVRDQIKEFAGTKKLFSSGVKLIILDEADAMTGDAQAALRRVIEKYTSNTRFCLVCNYVNKIIPALQSRCTRFRFSPLKPEQIRARLQDIVTAEKVHITAQGQEALISLSGGDMRRVLNLLQSAHMTYTHLQGSEGGVGGSEEVVIDEKEVYLTAGAALPGVIHAIVTALLNQPYIEAYQFIVKAIDEFGYALTDIVTEINKIILTRQLPDQGMAFILDKLSNIELRLSHGGNERLQLGAL